MTFKTTLLAGTVLGVAALVSAPALAQTTARTTAPATTAAPAATAAQVDALNKQIQALQSQLDSLKTQVDKDIKAVDKKVADAPTVSIANGRPRIQSADRNFDFSVQSRVHLDYGYWFPDQGVTTDLPDGFSFRRAFLGVGGTVFKDWGYNLTLDFGNSGRGNVGRIQNFGLSYNGVKNWAFDIGAIQPSFTLMDSISSNDIPFIERSQANNIAIGIVANEARLSAGFRHWGERYRVSVYATGQQINQAGTDDQAAIIGRASVLAATGTTFDVHLGASAGYLYEPAGNATPGATTYSLGDRPETRAGGAGSNVLNFGTGTINTDDYAVYGAEFGATYRSFWTMAEYYRNEFTQKLNGPDVDFDTWYVAAGWLITGERRPYNVAGGSFGSPRVQWPFKTSGGYGTGAFELVARYSVADLVDGGVAVNGSTTSAAAITNRATQGEQKIWTLGLNWYANQAVRFMANYNIIEVDRPTGIDVEVDALTLRTQIAF